jgi:hypothetical protein
MHGGNIQEAAGIRPLADAELDIVSGGSGNMYDFGIIRIMWWTDGAVSVGLKSIGSILVAPGDEGTSVQRD